MSTITLPLALQPLTVSENALTDEREAPTLVWSLVKQFRGKETTRKQLAQALSLPLEQCNSFLDQLVEAGFFEEVKVSLIPCPAEPESQQNTVQTIDFDEAPSQILSVDEVHISQETFTASAREIVSLEID